MADFPSLEPKDIANLTLFFGNGFVCRYAMSKVRGHRADADLHTITLAVVASLILWAPFALGEALVNGRWAVRADLQLPCTTALFLALSYVIGLIWGYAPTLAQKTKWEWLKERLGSVQSQSIIQFLKRGQNNYMRFRLENNWWYEGWLDYYDHDPERFMDLHIAIKWPAHKVDNAFKPLEGVDHILLCLSDIKTMQIMAGPPEQLHVESALDLPPVTETAPLKQ